MKGEVEVPPHAEIVRTALGIAQRDSQALYTILYLTAGRINEVLPKKRIRRRKTDRGTKEVRRWSEDLDYPGLRKSDIGFETISGRDFMTVEMLNEKNRSRRRKTFPILIEKEGPLVEIVREFISPMSDEQVLFPFSTVTAWTKLKKHAPELKKPHHLRHFRVTHLITRYRLQGEEIIFLTGWTDSRPLKVYSHLNWTNVAKRM